MSLREEQKQEFLKAHGWGDTERSFLAGDASFRSYERLRRPVQSAVLPDAPPPEGCDPFVKDDMEHLVLMDAPPPKEDTRPFIYIARFLSDHGLHAPQIIAEERHQGFLLLEDLGDDRFTTLLNHNHTAEFEATLYQQAIDVLITLHNLPIPSGLPLYDDRLLKRELVLLTDWYLPLLYGSATSLSLREEFLSLWDSLLPMTLMHDHVLVLRDYHADNLMHLPHLQGLESIGLLDFQDGVIGSPAYDLVSLLEDARRDVDPELAQTMIDYYLSHCPSVERESFKTSYALLGAQRNIKILGIFSRLLLRDNKPHYISFIPRVWRYLEHDLQHPVLAKIRHWLDTHIPQELRHTTPEMPTQMSVIANPLP